MQNNYDLWLARQSIDLSEYNALNFG
jgi:hypothetical protein